MGKNAVFCKCKNTYTNKCDYKSKKCKAYPIWKQGIGDIGGKTNSN
jgi:hypothetical protein